MRHAASALFFGYYKIHLCLAKISPTDAEQKHINEAFTSNYRMSNISADICLPSGPLVTDDDVRNIVEKINEAGVNSSRLRMVMINLRNKF